MIDTKKGPGGEPSEDAMVAELNETRVVSIKPSLRPRGERQPHELRQIEGPGAPQVFELTDESVIVGRERTVGICIPSAQLSRRHLRVDREGEVFRCRDLESKNGTFLDGVRIASEVLRDGDIIQVGDVVFEYWERR